MDLKILLIIMSLMTSKDYVNASTVKLSQNISRLLSENETEIECSYTVENILQIDSVSFLAFNDSSITFEQIVTYLPDTKSLITRRGQYLRGRVTLSDITKSSTKAAMVFNKLLCIDYTLYKCYVRYIDSGGVGREATSNNIRISVPVPPSTPERIILSRKSTPVITEGDNVTYVCTGDVGTPPAKFIFQKFGHENVLLVNYTVTKTSTHEFSVNCSFYRTSYITFKVTADDNQTVMRCAAVSTTLAAENMYVESQPLEVNCK
ncbi:ALCAM [Mytilus coruscus]|uniref:ALCAM n=1 Tax=Mytilus coruscus TaxID=42192 RepID=A0A6J8AHY9_MYTCO|nr:ALCAM [Mytilus coruscus]